MKQGTIAVIAVALLIVAAGAGIYINFNNNDKTEDADFAGYPVKTVDNLDNGIVAVGQDTFRWVTYFGLADKCVMVDKNDSTNYMAKAFMYVGKGQALAAHPDLKFTSVNCGVDDKDIQNIIALDPSVVVVPAGFEIEYKKQMDALRAADLHIVHIGYIYTFLEKGSFQITSDLEKQIDVLAKTFGKEDRGTELKNAFSSVVEDIRNIASAVTERKNAYVGCLAYNGAHGADSSIAYYMPFALANIDNIMEGQEMKGDSGVNTYSSIDISRLMKPDTVLLMDATGMYTSGDTTASTGVLKLFAGHDAYIAYPYIWTGINYEDVLICAYQLLHDVYGLLTDAQLKEKVNEVHKKFLGTEFSNRSERAGNTDAPTTETTVYDDMSNMYETRMDNPTHGEITISSTGTWALKV